MVGNRVVEFRPDRQKERKQEETGKINSPAFL